MRPLLFVPVLLALLATTVLAQAIEPTALPAQSGKRTASPVSNGVPSERETGLSFKLEALQQTGGILRHFTTTNEALTWWLDHAMPVDSGYVLGTNRYGDRGKATSFTLPNQLTEANVRQATVYFTAKDVELNDESYTLRIYAGTPETGPTGEPLYSGTYPMSGIALDEWTIFTRSPIPVVHRFPEPVAVGSSFFVAIEFGDVLSAVPGALAIGGSDREMERVAEVWEMGPTGLWQNLSDMWFTDPRGYHLWVETVVETGGGTQVILNQVDQTTYPNVAAIVGITDDNGVPRLDLAPSDITIHEQATSMDVAQVLSMDPEMGGMQTVLVFDQSASLSYADEAVARIGARFLVDRMTGSDEAALVGFGEDPIGVYPLSRSQEELRSVVQGDPLVLLSASGTPSVTSTNMMDIGVYDLVATGASIGYASPGRGAMIVVTGPTTGTSMFTPDAAIEAARKSFLPVYVIQIGASESPAGDDPLLKLATATGGRLIQADGASVVDQFSTLVEQLHYQYLVAYTSTGTPGTSKVLEVTVSGANGSTTSSITFDVPQTYPTLPDTWSCPEYSGRNAIVHIPASADLLPEGRGFEPGDAIGAFIPGENVCAGIAHIQEGKPTLLFAHLDNPDTEEVEGFQEGAEMQFRLFDASANTDYVLTATTQGDDLAFLPEHLYVLTGTAFSTPLPSELVAGVKFEAGPVFPNPASNRVGTTVVLPDAARVTVRVYNLLGAEVAVPIDTDLPAGPQPLRWSVANLASGAYFYRVQAGEHTATGRLVVVQ